MSVTPICLISYVINYIKNWLTKSMYLKFPKFMWSLWADHNYSRGQLCWTYPFHREYKCSKREYLVFRLARSVNTYQRVECFCHCNKTSRAYMWSPAITGRQSSLVRQHESRSNKPPTQVMRAIGLHSGMCEIWSSDLSTPRAPDNMRIWVKYACKNSKYSLIENLRSNITHKNS